MRKPKQRVIFLFFIFSIYHGITMAPDPSLCGDWELYKDEKCFKIFDKVGFQTYDDAIKTCIQENSSSLVIIRSKDEQDFLSNFLFKTNNILDNVWIGAKYNINKFKWADDSDISFTNWVEGSPRNRTDYCIQMQSDVSSIGKWIDEPCGKKNLVVCEKIQTWSVSHLQKILLNARKELKDSFAEEKDERTNSFNNLKKELEDTKKLLNNIQQNPVPIGFVYVQLPGQTEPKNLWPAVGWEEVSSEFAGLFFRVEGGGSAKFGETQEENSPRITRASLYNNWIELHPYAHKTNFTPGSVVNITTGWFKEDWDKPLETYVSRESALCFEVSSGEVRPRNKAMRIWKRTN